MTILTINANRIANKKVAQRVQKFAETHVMLLRYRDDTFKVHPISEVPADAKCVALLDLRVKGKTQSETYRAFNNAFNGRSIDQVRSALEKCGIRYQNLGTIDWAAMEVPQLNKRYKVMERPVEKNIKLLPGMEYRILKDAIRQLREITGENYGLVMDHTYRHFALTLDNSEVFQSTSAAGLRDKLINRWSCLKMYEMTDEDKIEAAEFGLAQDLLSLLF